MPASPESLRLFIAVELDLDEELLSLQKQMQAFDRDRTIRWTAIDSIHLTLKFLGETPANRQAAITAAMTEATKGHKPFGLTLEGTGCFPNTRKPRIVWAGLGGEIKALHTLRDAVERTVSPLGYPTEDRPFSPHLTLGRARQEASAAALAALGAQIEKLHVGKLAAWQVEGISLMRSELKSSGAVYTQLAYAALG
jgi:2'-5' RNA ligase